MCVMFSKLIYCGAVLQKKIDETYKIALVYVRITNIVTILTNLPSLYCMHQEYFCFAKNEQKKKHMEIEKAEL